LVELGYHVTITSRSQARGEAAAVRILSQLDNNGEKVIGQQKFKVGTVNSMVREVSS
jgi:hypothetical protein